MDRIIGTRLARLVTLLLLFLLGSSLTMAQLTSFTYQGRLTDGGGAATGAYDLQFRLFDALVGGNQVGATVVRDDVTITNGIFSVALDFGAAAFPGANRFLETGVRPGTSVGAFATLSPLQPITSTPYAVQSLNAATATIAVNFSGTLAGEVTGPQTATALADNVVTMAKLADGSVTDAKIADIAGSKLTGSITNATIPGANVTGAVANAANAASLGAPGGVYAYSFDAAGAGPYPSLGFNSYGNFPYLAGVAGYGGIFQFQDGDGKFGFYSTNSVVAAGGAHTFIPRLVILNNGKVGIGTTNPNSKVSITGTSGTDSLEIRNQNGSFAFGVDDFGNVAIGKTLGSSTIHACFTANTSLYFAACSSAAEYVPTLDDGRGYAQAADLVSIAPSVKNPYGDEHSPFVVTKSAKPCDENLLGFIVNPESGADGKKLNDHDLPLAIYGYFPAKVTLENGAIKRGDPITSSSKPGYGMKATQACKIVGYALEDAEQEGKIQVFAHLGEYTAPQVAALEEQVRQLQGEKREQMEALKTQSAALEARLAALEQAVEQLKIIVP